MTDDERALSRAAGFVANFTARRGLHLRGKESEVLVGYVLGCYEYFPKLDEIEESA